MQTNRPLTWPPLAVEMTLPLQKMADANGIGSNLVNMRRKLGVALGPEDPQWSRTPVPVHLCQNLQASSLTTRNDNDPF